MVIWVASTSYLLWIMLQWTWMYKYLFEILFSVLLNVFSEVGLLDHMVVLFLIFRGTFILFSIVAALHSYQKYTRVPIYPCLHQHLLFSVVLIVAILMDMRWFPIVVLIWISLMISDVEYLFFYFLFYLFIFGYIGSWLLCAGFLLVAASRGFSFCRARALGVRTSVVVARGLGSCVSQA